MIQLLKSIAILFLLLLFTVVSGQEKKPSKFMSVINKEYLQADKMYILEGTLAIDFNLNEVLSLAASYYYLKKKHDRWYLGWGIGVGYNYMIKLSHVDSSPTKIFEIAHGDILLHYKPIKYISFDFGAKIANVAYGEAFGFAPGLYLATEVGLSRLKVGTRVTSTVLIKKQFPFFSYVTPFYIRYYIFQ